MKWWVSLLAGAGSGLLLAFIIIPIITLYKRTKERLKIKKMIKNGEFLIPLDKRDYNYEAWKDNINIDEQENQLQNLDNKIFKREMPIQNNGQ